MNVFWYLFNWWLTWTWTDFAAIGWWKAGEDWIITFLKLSFTSTILLLGYFGVFSGASWALKKFLYPRIKRGSGFKKRRIVKFILGCYSWFKKTRVVRFILACYSWWQERSRVSIKWGKRLAEIMGKYRYLILFLLNLIPYVPYLSAITIVAAKRKKIPYAIWIILAGNTTKVFWMVALVYTSPTWLSWCRYMIGKIF